MGKKGDLLRALKAVQKTYTFNHEQLQEHDRVVIRDALLKAEKELMKKAQAEYDAKNEELKKVIADEWETREKIFMENHPNENVISLMSLLLATSCRVLIERFGWKPIPQEGHFDRRNRTMRYCEEVEREIGRITADPEKADLIAYCNETYNLYGVKFITLEKEGYEDTTEAEQDKHPDAG